MFTGVAALGLYTIAFVLLLISFQERRAQSFFYGAMLAGLCAHLYFLYRIIDTPTGQNLNVFNMLSLMTALWVAIVGISNLTTKLRSLFLVVLPLAAASILPIWARSASVAPVLLPLGEDPLALSHILLALGAYALLGVSFLQAMALAIQRRYLSLSPAHSVLPYLPPLEAMQNLMMRILLVAFTLLTLALGFGMAAHGAGSILMSFKSAVSAMVWVLCAVLLVLYYRVGLQVRYAILGIGLAWLGLSLAYVGMKIW
ncbi:MAG: cytochrome c biogenesis protein CcsA [Gammaproteobacteria bacterium]